MALLELKGLTKTFNIISGFLPPTSGKVISKKGIVRTFQFMNLWRDSTVMDTMRIALHDLPLTCDTLEN